MDNKWPYQKVGVTLLNEDNKSLRAEVERLKCDLKAENDENTRLAGEFNDIYSKWLEAEKKLLPFKAQIKAQDAMIADGKTILRNLMIGIEKTDECFCDEIPDEWRAGQNWPNKSPTDHLKAGEGEEDK